MAERAILAPHNSIVQEVNNAVAAKFPGEEWVCSSADVIVDEENAVAIPTEYLNSLEVSGLPPHRLCLKPGMLIMLLCNLAPKDGLCNGTRLLVQRVINEQLLQATIAGSHQTVLIPRIALQPTDESFPFVWQRRQFPVRLAFAMTINKSQGQTLQRVGVYLRDPVFTHGQLYVAASRIFHPQNIRFAVAADSFNKTKNVVYREVLLDSLLE